jgi:uroporphyrinogen decarboxylase
MATHPLPGEDPMTELGAYRFPDPRDPRRSEGLYAKAERYRRDGYPVIVAGTIGNGFLQTGNFLRGFENFLCDLLINRAFVEALLDKVLELKLAWWDRILDELGDLAQVVLEQDDLGTQQGLFISPEQYRTLIKPRQRQLFGFIKRKAPGVKIFFHSCGSVFRIIPDLIEVGVDILNPVQISAAEMEPARLKKEFGKSLVFWGGGIDTQKTLAGGTGQAVRDEVKRNIDCFAPGGGFIFATVHSIQGDVPLANLFAMWEAFRENCRY